MYYKGTLKNCQDYNAIVSYSQGYMGIVNENAAGGLINKVSKDGVTKAWSEKPRKIDNDFYIEKHPNYSSTILIEVAELPEQPVTI